jgi:hypothetical protein
MQLEFWTLVPTILSRLNGFIYPFEGACSQGLLGISRERRSNGRSHRRLYVAKIQFLAHFNSFLSPPTAQTHFGSHEDCLKLDVVISRGFQS